MSASNGEVKRIRIVDYYRQKNSKIFSESFGTLLSKFNSLLDCIEVLYFIFFLSVISIFKITHIKATANEGSSSIQDYLIDALEETKEQEKKMFCSHHAYHAHISKLNKQVDKSIEDNSLRSKTYAVITPFLIHEVDSSLSCTLMLDADSGGNKFDYDPYLELVFRHLVWHGYLKTAEKLSEQTGLTFTQAELSHIQAVIPIVHV